MTEIPPEPGLATGSPILTPCGEVPVQEIVPGTLVIALSGAGAPFRPVQSVRRRRRAAGLVRIRAGALADSAPLADLLLAPGHGVFLDGGLVAAGALALGPGITAEAPAPDDLFELVLAEHDAVLAAGMAVETALPEPGAAPFCARVEPDGVLRAMLAWRAEIMGWAAPATPQPLPPEVGSLRERLSACPSMPALRPDPLPRGRE